MPINDAIEDFNMGRIGVIVATDIISRNTRVTMVFPLLTLIPATKELTIFLLK